MDKRVNTIFFVFHMTEMMATIEKRESGANEMATKCNAEWCTQETELPMIEYSDK